MGTLEGPPEVAGLSPASTCTTMGEERSDEDGEGRGGRDRENTDVCHMQHVTILQGFARAMHTVQDTNCGIAKNKHVLEECIG